MVDPLLSNEPGGDNGRPTAPLKMRRVLDLRVLLGTFLAFTALGIGMYFWRAYQVRQTASALTKRAETLAEEGKLAAAVPYYTRYLELRPDDADARLRRAELFDQSSNDPRRLHVAIGLYQEGVAASKDLAAARRIAAHRRLTELLLQSGAFRSAESEAEKLSELEKKELGAKPSEWHAAGLKALALAGRYGGKDPGLSGEAVEKAFAEVLDSKGEQGKVYVDADVYLARYGFRLAKELRQAKTTSGTSYLAASSKAKVDLDAALELAPRNLAVLLTAASAAQREASAATMALQESTTTAPESLRSKASECNALAVKYFERAMQADPADSRAYHGLGQLYGAQGNLDRALQTWRRGLEKTKANAARIELELDVADALIQQQRLAEADGALKNVADLLAKLDPQLRLALQRFVDLRSARVAYLRGHFDETIALVADLASGKQLSAANENNATSQMQYEAWLLLGQSHAALEQLELDAARQNPATARGRLDKAQEHLDNALVAFDQAAQLNRQDPAPLLSAGGACRAAARRERAVTYYQGALDRVDAIKPPPAAQRQFLYDALVALLDELKRPLEADRYRANRARHVAGSPTLTFLSVTQAIRSGKAGEALALAQEGVRNHPGDALAQFALGRAEQTNRHGDKAAEAYRKAFQIAKDLPAVQMQLADYLLQSRDPRDVEEGESALRALLPKNSQAGLQLVVHLAIRKKQFDEALAVARQCLQLMPKDPMSHITLGTAWWGKKENAKAEAEFQEAVRLAPDAPGPARALLEFYVDSGLAQLARESLEQMLKKVNVPETTREMFRGDMLLRIGDRKAARLAYTKAVEASQEDPAVQMRFAEFLLSGSDPGEAAKGENLLRRIMRQHDPARRRLAEVLIARGGEVEWDEAQKLLEQSAGDPTAMSDRFIQARLLAGRGGQQNFEKAATICQGLMDEAKRPLPAVNLLLAQIHELQGNLEDSRKLYRELVAADPPAATPLVSYLGFLLRHGPPTETDQRLKQLEKLLPENLGAAELRAHWLRDQKRAAEIEPLVEGLAATLLTRLNKDNPLQEAQLSRAVGDLYLRIELSSAAERWYRRLLRLNPQNYEPLVMALTKQGRIQEAMTMCKEAAKSDASLRPALMMAAILTSGRAAPLDLESAEPMLKQALESHKDQPALLNCMAGIKVLNDRPGEAVALYRQLLKQQPKNVAVLNDLATVLGEQPNAGSRKEAMECIERAIELAGPQPSLLDTKGMVLFFDEKPDRALAALQAAVQTPGADPRYYFHLAVVYGRLGQLDKSRTALQQAREGDLEHQLLTKKDRQLLADLEKQLAH